MKPAFYMKFNEGHRGCLDRVGGVPTHLPSLASINPHTGRERAFLAQFYCSPGRLEFPNILCLHLYQDVGEDEPCPVVVAVPIDAALNQNLKGIVKPGIKAFDIEWEYREDPEDSTTDDVDLGLSKIGGTTYFEDSLDAGDRFLLQLRQNPAKLNFGGYTVVVVINSEGLLDTRLG